ncbi:unnamed protein product [Ceutorhynchus assimilis]|uniref:BMP-binding endothelial regulator protein n=1 Tax=Ceutorhynchus assimilis TaxID=467358 RepID=A0A9P0DP09_9CUCU|nr:unnamed protein product [Ceutorhynchus assimilis]
MLKMDKYHRHWWLAFTLIMAEIAATFGTGMAPLPAGKRQTCPNEGEPVTTGFDAQIVDCFSCICKNGYVECKNNCPRVDECHLVVEKNDCCKICKGCTYKGLPYDSHTEWIDPVNPCKIMRCEAGIITVSDLQCHTPCPNPLPPEPGKCCKTCPVCQINGQVVAEDRDVVSEDDPCLKCRCKKGQLTCSKKACPVLQCHPSMQHKLPGECCPRCNGTRAIILLEHTCPIQKYLYKEGQDYKIDRCTHCMCMNNTSICTRNACPILDCSSDLQRTMPGHCCPTCIKPKIEEMISECHQGGHTYEDGNVWQLDECSSCKCHDGKVSCARITCNTTCAAGMKQIKVKGECCKKCVENDGACMAFGDPHYKTFDGKIYTFKGIGKYQLIRDCQNNTFSIRVANYVADKYMDSPITRRVQINFGKNRLILQQRLRVKYNGHKMALPFRMEGQFRVSKLKDSIEVRLQNDVVILWNGRSFLEVTVPPVYKGKLCGLCGNFNGDVQDDLRTKSGKTVSDKELLVFGTSWCVGKKTECAKKYKQNQRESSDVRSCKYLNYEIFSACESKLSNSKYYKACKMDMYNCNSGKCYCESLLAYARECERLGVNLSNWQKYSNCDSHNPQQRYSNNNYRSKHKHHQSSQAPSSEEILRYSQINLAKMRPNSPHSSRKPIPLH